MRAVATARVTRGRLRSIALAAALACTTSSAYAGLASVVIDGFVISSSAADGSFVFGPFDTMNQAWDLEVLIDGGTVDQDAGSSPDWNPSNATAQEPNTMATVSSYQFTDPFTQLISPGFALSATANLVPDRSLRTAVGNMLSSGSFCFWDSTAPFDGTSGSCSGAGSLTFTVFYDLVVSAAPLTNSAFAQLSVMGTGVPGGLFVDSASGNGSKEDQFFTWTVDLASGNSASFSLEGIVVAEAVPEPGALGLAALGLLALFLARRRSGAALPI
jgi:hypothetical protein